MSTAKTILSSQTLISWGLVASLLIAAVSYGALQAKVNTNKDEILMLRSQVSMMDSKLDQLIGSQSVAKY
jgi:hypothetical protein